MNSPDPEVLVFPDAAALSQAAAQRFVAIARKAVAARGRFTVALSGGSTPQALYRLLSQPPYTETVPWAQTHVFWGDERLVPPDHPGSNYGQAAHILLDRVPIPAAHIHRARGELAPDEAVADYSRQLAHFAAGGRAWPRLDLALMGTGGDGHTASLFPGPIPDTEKQQPVMTVTADYDGRPAQRITLTPLVFNDARHVLFLVTGESKAAALAAVLHGPFQPEQWPAQRIQPANGKLIWMVDEAAAGQLAPAPTSTEP